MRRWIAFAAVLYPRSWRAEFGREFRVVLNDVKPSWRVFANVLRGALEMRMIGRTNWMKLVGLTAMAGAIVGVGLSYRLAPLYVSSAAIRVTPLTDPARPESPEAIRRRAAERVAELENEVLSRASLAPIIQDPRALLYPTESSRIPFEAVIEEMRRNILLERRPAAGGGTGAVVLRISFSDPDPTQAQAAVRVLTNKLLELNMDITRFRQRAYEDFWRRVSEVEPTKSAPSPAGEVAEVMEAASLPVGSVGPHRIMCLAWALGSGRRSVCWARWRCAGRGPRCGSADSRRLAACSPAPCRS
jgi:hypothetical protein